MNKERMEAKARAECAQKPYPDGDTSILACPTCGSGEYLYNEDGNRCAFCGQCGQAIDWDAEVEIMTVDIKRREINMGNLLWHFISNGYEVEA